MKKRASFCIGVVGTTISLFLGGAAETSAAPANPTDSILQQELKQQQIRSTTQRVRDQLDAVIGEFDRNAISGADVGVLKAIRSVLGVLTEKDMQLVLEYLQKAREAADPKTSTREATEAYARQKAIITKLKALEAEYRRQAELYELSIRFKELANRQSTYMWQTRDLAKRSEGRHLTESQMSDLHLLQIDQAPLVDEMKPYVSKLARLADETTDGPTAERPKQALRQVTEGGLSNALMAASSDLQSAKLMSATGNQKKARDQFREIARLLTLAQGEVESLRQALRELEQTMDAQKEVMKDTRNLEPKDRDNRMETRQGQVVDSTDLIKRDIDSLAPVASDHLKSAIDKMQEARLALDSEKDPVQQRQKAPPKQAEALASMEQARRALQELLAKAEAESSTPENAIAALKDLQEKVKDLVKAEEKLKDETAATEKKDLPSQAGKQGDLKDKTQEVQSQAASQSPPAAQSLGEAANQMQKAQSSLANAQSNAPAQQAAIDALKKADQQLGQEISRLEQAQQELAKLEEMLKKLAAVIEEQQKVQFNTAKEALKKQPPPLNELAGSQQKLANDTGQLQQEASAPVPAAASHLEAAKTEMNNAKTALDKTAPKEAQPKQTEALTELYAARKEMEKKADELRNMLGMPTDPSAQSLADASALIDKAQQNVSQAMENLQQSPPGVMESLLQQQQQIADALGQLSQGAPPTAPVNKAQQSANQAARQLGQSNLPGAIGAMQQAQNSMQQAMQSGQQPQQGQQGAEQGQQGGQQGQQGGQQGQQGGQQGQQGGQQGEQGGQQGEQGGQQGKQGGQQGQQAQQGSQQGAPSLPGLSQQQAEVQKMAESLLAAQQAAPAGAMDQAARQLTEAGNIVGPLTSGSAGPLPSAAQSALQSAQGALANGAAQAQAGQNAPAQGNAASAAQSLAQAQAALALAQAGLGSGQAMANAQGQGQGQGQGQAQGQGQGQGQVLGQGTPGPRGTGRMGNWAGAGGADGSRRSTFGPGAFTGLPMRDRAAIQQSQAEKYPQEYGPLVEQYLKNLSDQVNK